MVSGQGSGQWDEGGSGQWSVASGQWDEGGIRAAVTAVDRAAVCDRAVRAAVATAAVRAATGQHAHFAK